ncbi:MAG: metallophosphoesterase, partial [Spirochaetota bacterium]
MASKEIKLVISDLHLGSGLLTEEGEYNFREAFSEDSTLHSFLQFYRTGKYLNRKIELIINGDFFETLEVSEYSRSPLEMTAELACERIEQILDGHPLVFEAFIDFLSSPEKQIRFIPGNHDMVLIFPEVQEFLRKRISPKLQFSVTSYSFLDVYIEHGNQYQLCTNFDLDNLTK